MLTVVHPRPNRHRVGCLTRGTTLGICTATAVLGLVLLVGGIVLVRIYEGDFDRQWEEDYEECIISCELDYLRDGSRECGHCVSYEEWDDTKDTCRTFGIIAIVIAMVLFVVTAVIPLVVFLPCCCNLQQGHVIDDSQATVMAPGVTGYTTAAQVPYAQFQNSYSVQQAAYPMQQPAPNSQLPAYTEKPPTQ